MGSLINFHIKNDFHHMQSAVIAGKWDWEGAGGLDRSCVNACNCPSCVVVKGAVSMRLGHSVTLYGYLNLQASVQTVLVTLGFLVEGWRGGREPSLAHRSKYILKRAHRTCPHLQRCWHGCSLFKPYSSIIETHMLLRLCKKTPVHMFGFHLEKGIPILN